MSVWRISFALSNRTADFIFISSAICSQCHKVQNVIRLFSRFQNGSFLQKILHFPHHNSSNFLHLAKWSPYSSCFCTESIATHCLYNAFSKSLLFKEIVLPRAKSKCLKVHPSFSLKSLMHSTRSDIGCLLHIFRSQHTNACKYKWKLTKRRTVSLFPSVCRFTFINFVIIVIAVWGQEVLSHIYMSKVIQNIYKAAENNTA